MLIGTQKQLSKRIYQEYQGWRSRRDSSDNSAKSKDLVRLADGYVNPYNLRLVAVPFTTYITYVTLGNTYLENALNDLSMFLYLADKTIAIVFCTVSQSIRLESCDAL